MNLARSPVPVQITSATPSAQIPAPIPTAGPAADQFTQYFLNHSIRVAGTAINPLFMTADVAKYIADVNVRKLVSDYPTKYLVKTQHRDFPNQSAGVNFFTEKGLYYYLMKSRRPKAEEFQDWVLDLLTSLRRLYIDDLLLANKIAGKQITTLRDNMDWMTVSFYDDMRLDSCPLGLAEFHIARYISSQYSNMAAGFNTSPLCRENVPEWAVDLIYQTAIKYFRQDQHEIMISTAKILQNLQLGQNK